ncbi:MAG: hypothetical protein CW338_10975 [Clostridiales bacterium]|nr:hypothetical protein [Clostridiales bacterium]
MKIDEQMTVVELHAVAKEIGIKLPAGLDKKGIMEKLASDDGELKSEQETVAERTETEPKPVRKASIISDDDEDDYDSTPAVYSVNRSFQSAPASTAPVRSSTSSLNNISSKAPAFTMEGARAWHNPRSYNPAPPAQSYARTQWSTKPVFPQGSPFTSPASQSGDSAQQAAPAPAPYRSARPADPTEDTQSRPASGSRYPQIFPREMSLDESQAEFAYQERLNNPKPDPVEPSLTPETLLSSQCDDGKGILDISTEGDGFLRVNNYLPGKNDIYISYQQIHRYKLRKGDQVEGKIRATEKFPVMLYIETVNGIPVDNITSRDSFEDLTPIYPRKKFNFSSTANLPAEARIIDLLSPIGFGQRALITTPVHCGKTSFMVHLYRAVRMAEPDAKITYISIDETPENLALIRQQVGKDIVSLACDQSFENMVKMCELALENAIRTAEARKPAVIIIDSITKLASAFNAVSPAASRTLANKLTAYSFNGVKKFFGTARNTKEGGSVTVIAAADADTQLAEDLSGYANMTLALDKETASKKVFPAVLLSSMSTKKGELLLTADEAKCRDKLCEFLFKQPNDESVSQLHFMFDKAATNEELSGKVSDWLLLLGK